MGVLEKPTWATVLLVLLHTSTGFTEKDACSLPSGWAGSWFESGVRGVVDVDLHSISHKGRCVKQLRHGNQFIFRSSSEGNCVRCLSIHLKHANVLQYKGSKCMQDRDPRQYRDICRSISVDEPLTSLFRVNASGVDCPVHGTYSFSYSRGHGVCDYPLSSLHQCQDRSRLVFNYQACVDIKGSQSQREEAQCLAHWKEGSTYYFVAMMNSSHVDRQQLESSFRCFVYKEVHTGFLLSQSAEAKCNLYTAVEGFRTMALKRLKEEGESCSYPEWFTAHRRYHSLSGKRAFQLNRPGTSLTVEVGMEKTELECLRKKEGEGVEGLESATFTVQSVQSCSVGFHCLKIEKKTNNVFQLKIGRKSPNAEDACHPQLFFDSSVPQVTVTTAHLHVSPCPLTGNFALRATATHRWQSGPAGSGGVSRPLQDPSPKAKLARELANAEEGHLLEADEGHLGDLAMMANGSCSTLSTLKSACAHSHQMAIAPCGRGATVFSCHDWWSEEGPSVKKSFSIVSYKSKSTSAKRCLVKTLSSKEDEFSLSLKREDCDSNSEEGDNWSFAALNLGDCAPTALATSNSALQKACSRVCFVVPLIAARVLLLPLQ